VKRILAFAAAAIAVAGTAAAEFMPAVIFDMGGKFDKSFNEAHTTAQSGSKLKPALNTLSSKSPTLLSVKAHCVRWLNLAQTQLL
jgi:basic membrane lipoprotein Med (substrate-binding protein (PBP1-ABC) superfamily)